MNRSDAPAEAKPLLDILDHYYGAGPHACKCKHLVDKESIDAIVTSLRDYYGIFYQPEPLTLQKDWKEESNKWETMYRTVDARLQYCQVQLSNALVALEAMKNRVRKAEGLERYQGYDEDWEGLEDDEVDILDYRERYEDLLKHYNDLLVKVQTLNARLLAEKGIEMG